MFDLIDTYIIRIVYLRLHFLNTKVYIYFPSVLFLVPILMNDSSHYPIFYYTHLLYFCSNFVKLDRNLILLWPKMYVI